MAREVRVDLTEDTAYTTRADDQKHGVMLSLTGSFDDDRDILAAAVGAAADALNQRQRYQEADQLLNALKRSEPDLGRPQRVSPEGGDNEQPEEPVKKKK